jgi:hypothetical protein
MQAYLQEHASRGAGWLKGTQYSLEIHFSFHTFWQWAAPPPPRGGGAGILVDALWCKVRRGMILALPGSPVFPSNTPFLTLGNTIVGPVSLNAFCRDRWALEPTMVFMTFHSCPSKACGGKRISGGQHSPRVHSPRVLSPRVLSPLVPIHVCTLRCRGATARG